MSFLFAVIFSILFAVPAFALNVSKVPHCRPQKKSKISEDIKGEYSAVSEYVENDQRVTVEEKFLITDEDVLEIPQLYTAEGNEIVKDAETKYCLSVVGKDKKSRDRLTVRLIGIKKNKLSKEKTKITYTVIFDEETQKYTWKYKISEKTYFLYFIPAGGSFWSDEYDLEKIY